jgi:hypothetical protein
MSITVRVELEADVEDKADTTINAVCEAAIGVFNFGTIYNFGTLQMEGEDKLRSFTGLALAEKLRNTIWSAAGCFVPVRVRVLYIEQTPQDYLEYEDEEEYKEWARTTTD